MICANGSQCSRVIHKINTLNLRVLGFNATINLKVSKIFSQNYLYLYLVFIILEYPSTVPIPIKRPSSLENGQNEVINTTMYLKQEAVTAFLWRVIVFSGSKLFSNFHLVRYEAPDEFIGFWIVNMYFSSRAKLANQQKSPEKLILAKGEFKINILSIFTE